MSILQKRLKAYFTKNQKRIHDAEITICLGNEGMDLDSFISSLIVGFAEDVIHVVNMKKEVFMCKGEITHVCSQFNIDFDDLIYLERPLGDLSADMKEIGSYFLVGKETIPIKNKNIKLYLTDHNEPVKELCKSEVSMIIDHHRLENNVEKAKRIYIDIDVGSATTLVAKYLGRDLSKKHHCVKDRHNTDPEKDTLCVSIAKLILVPIIIDTKHLKRRTSVFDKNEYKRLKKKANMKKKELKTLRKVIKRKRLNDDKLPTEIILQKDFKEYSQDNIKFGIAAIKYKFEDWIDRDGEKVDKISKDNQGIALSSNLNDFRKKAGLDFLIIGCKLKGKRHYIFINFPLVDHFSKDNLFEKVEYKGLEFYKAPVEASRKIISPKIREFLFRLKNNIK